MENKPSRLLDVLTQCEALAQLLPLPQGATRPLQNETWAVLDQAAQQAAPLPVRYGLLTLLWQTRTGTDGPLLKRLPRDCRELAELLLSEITAASQCGGWSAAQWMPWLMRCDAFRRPQRFLLLVQACALWLQREVPAAAVLAAAQGVRLPNDHLVGGPEAAHAPAIGPEIAARLYAARTQAIARHWAESRP